MPKIVGNSLFIGRVAVCRSVYIWHSEKVLSAFVVSSAYVAFSFRLSSLYCCVSAIPLFGRDTVDFISTWKFSTRLWMTFKHISYAYFVRSCKLSSYFLWWCVFVSCICGAVALASHHHVSFHRHFRAWLMCCYTHYIQQTTWIREIHKWYTNNK